MTMVKKKMRGESFFCGQIPKSSISRFKESQQHTFGRMGNSMDKITISTDSIERTATSDSVSDLRCGGITATNMSPPLYNNLLKEPVTQRFPKWELSSGAI
jgi:hypothetical protein